MELRQYLEILKRQKWLIVEAIVIVAVVAGVLSALRTPSYTASARVLLRPNDPAEQLNPIATGGSNDPDRYVAAQVDIVTSPDVAAKAAKAIAGSSPDQLARSVSASQVGTSDLIDVSASGPDPERAARVANAFAASYIQNRKDFTVAGLQRAVDDLNVRLADLQKRTADLDAQINADAVAAAAAAELQQPTRSGVRRPKAPTAPTASDLTNGALPTGDEALKAARYAAATQYQTLFDRQQELTVNISLQRGQAEIVSKAKEPRSPTSPKPMRDALLGGFLGLLLGLGIAFLREHLDDRVRSREDVEAITGLPVLAELPFDQGSAKDPARLAVLTQPRGALSEATRSLRTSIGFLGVETPLRRVLVTSAEKGDGKSLVSANLAATYAQAGFRTILVDADLRNPRLHAVLGGYDRELLAAGESLDGLSSLVTALASGPSVSARTNGGNGNANGNGHANGNGNGKEHVDDVFVPTDPTHRRALVQAALLRTAVPNLLFLPAGPPPPNPAELLGSRFTVEILEALSQIADVVILDVPPLLPVTDAAVLAPRVDGVVMVAAVGEAHRSALRRARTALGDGTRVLGVVVNKVTDAVGYYGDYSAPVEDDPPARTGWRRLRAPVVAANRDGA